MENKDHQYTCLAALLFPQREEKERLNEDNGWKLMEEAKSKFSSLSHMVWWKDIGESFDWFWSNKESSVNECCYEVRFDVDEWRKWGNWIAKRANWNDKNTTTECKVIHR